jgi:uncharacterized small protein (TIGR04563 family)
LPRDADDPGAVDFGDRSDVWLAMRGSCYISPIMARPKPERDKTKQSLYFPEDMLQEIQREAERLERPLSWVVQRAWTIARREIGALPRVEKVE